MFEGGEGIVGKLLPRYTLLPGSTAESLIAAGLKQLPEDHFVKLAGPESVFHILQTAVAESRPLSLIRLGDGELLTLAHEVLIPTEEAVKRGPFLPYAGVELPAPSVRDALLDALRRAHLIGVPESRHPSFQGLLFPLLKHAGLSLRQLPLTTSTINFGLCEAGLMSQLLRGRRILAIGNKAEALAKVLRGAGIEVAGVIASVQGVKDVPMILDRATQVDFDIALVSAGIAAVLICVELAERKGKIALDFGHAADKLGTGELTF
ncbi:hypothetical protein DCC85_17580 [Paenibacillus sp. CAA11]|nr:hypothetical protein DCC85_17580 [Paenibacillus sp. CAA11]